jgi:hypothetical protein
MDLNLRQDSSFINYLPLDYNIYLVLKSIIVCVCVKLVD